MRGDSLVVGAVFAIYFAALIVVGALAWRRTADLADYIAGGRRLGRWVAALSAGASDMSGWLLLGLPGLAYAAGLDAAWLGAGLLAGTWLNWRLVAARLRRYSEVAGNALTLSAFLEVRFEDRTRLLRSVSAAFVLLFFLFYTSAGLVAGGKLFASVFGIPYRWAVVAGAVAILSYTLFGGFLAVCWTDLLQGLLMAAALAIVPVMAVVAEGGPGPAIADLDARNPHLLELATGADGASLGALALASLLGWGLGYFGQPHILARFLAIRSPDAVPGARRIAVTWTALGLAGAIACGLAGIVFLDEPLAGADAEKVFILLVSALFDPVVAGVLLAAILAAVMSTADSQLIVASSALAEDLYRPFVRPRASARELIAVGRGAVAAIGVAATVLALDPRSMVLDLVAYAWAGFGAAFGPTLLVSLYWRRMTAAGAMAGIVTGGVTVVVWKQLSGGPFDLYEIVPGFALSLVAIVVASLLGPPPPTVVTARHDAVIGAAREAG